MNSIIKKELYQYFTTMTGYIFLTALVFVTAIMFVSINIIGTNESYQIVIGASADYQTTLFSTLVMFLLLIPLLTMRLFAEETRQKTDQLIFTSPIKISSIVIGKFLAGLLVFLIGLLITLSFPIIINFYGDVLTPQLFSSILGYILLVSCFIAVGVFISSMTDNQITAAAVTFAFIFLFFMLDTVITSLPIDRTSTLIFLFFVSIIIAFIFYDSTKSKIASICSFLVVIGICAITFILEPSLFDNGLYKIISWFSLITRFDGFVIGIIDFSDVLYYISFIVIFIYLTITNLEKRRWK